MENGMQELQRIVIKEELLELIKSYYGNKNGCHMRAAYLNNMIFWQGIRLREAKKERSKIDRAINNNVSKSRIEKMEKSFRGAWFWKTSEEQMDELMGFCSPSSITRMNKEFKEQGWMEVGNNPDPKKKWDKSTWYKLDLLKINSDLNKLGYYLEGYKMPEENNDIDEENNGESPSDSIFHGENSNFRHESSSFHRENSSFHHEIPNFHDGKAIPEGVSEGVSEGVQHNVCVEEQQILELTKNREDLNEHTHEIINLFNSLSKRNNYKHDVFMKTLEIINLDIHDMKYLKVAIANNLKKGFVEEFKNGNKSFSVQPVRKEVIPDYMQDRDEYWNEIENKREKDERSTEEKKANIAKLFNKQIS